MFARSSSCVVRRSDMHAEVAAVRPSATRQRSQSTNNYYSEVLTAHRRRRQALMAVVAGGTSRSLDLKNAVPQSKKRQLEHGGDSGEPRCMRRPMRRQHAAGILYIVCSDFCGHMAPSDRRAPQGSSTALTVLSWAIQVVRCSTKTSSWRFL